MAPATAMAVLGLRFQIVQRFFGSLRYLMRQAGQPGDVDAVGAVCSTRHHPVEEDDIRSVLSHCDVGIVDALEAVGQPGQLVIVGGKERARADVIVDVLYDGASNGQPVVRACTSSHLVED